MAVQQLRARYVGTLAGAVWSIIHPVMLVLTYWLVFSVGFKVQPEGNLPFVVVFICGLIPWLTFSETLAGSVNAITQNVHLVKKVVFPTEILPIVHLLASLIIHGVMLLILMVLLYFYNLPSSLFFVQVIYYTAALTVFSLGLSWLLSAINVFSRDVGHIVTVLLNLWFWLTPIVWPMHLLPASYHRWIMINPMYYIVSGYRDTFLYFRPFWENEVLSIYFWIVCILMFMLGAFVFRRLKPEFADVL